MTLVTWSWLFLVLSIGAMLGIGFIGHRRVKHADDFATARGSYGPVFLAFAFAATTASGATFLGGPGLAYKWGAPTIWGNFLYPIGVYFGVLISFIVSKAIAPLPTGHIEEMFGRASES